MAQITIPELFVTVWTEAEGPVSMVVAPDGSGASFDQAESWGGATLDATIRVELTEATGVPIAMFPSEDIWLESQLGGLVSCTGGTVADEPTNSEGKTFWALPLRAGGFADPLAGDVLHVFINGDPYTGLELAGIRLVSPDLSGDLMVNLTDVAAFAHDFHEAVSGPTPGRSDFHWDEILNLVDVGILAGYMGVSCP